MFTKHTSLWRKIWDDHESLVYIQYILFKNPIPLTLLPGFWQMTQKHFLHSETASLMDVWWRYYNPGRSCIYTCEESIDTGFFCNSRKTESTALNSKSTIFRSILSILLWTDELKAQTKMMAPDRSRKCCVEFFRMTVKALFFLFGLIRFVKAWKGSLFGCFSYAG